MAGAPSWQDVYDAGLAATQARRPTLVVRPGDVSDAYLCGGATMANTVIGSAARGFRATFVDGAQADDLTIVCADRGVQRDDGDDAVVTVIFQRPTDTAGAGTITAGTRLASEPDPITGTFATYTTDNDIAFLSTDLSNSVDVTCTQVGATGNAAVGQITRILDTLFDGTITVVNDETAAGGSPAESDPDLRDRTKAFPQTLAQGTINALLYGAKQVPGVQRASLSVDPTTGIVSLYVSDQFGNSNQALADAVAATFVNDWRAAGDIVNVFAGTLFPVDVDITLLVRAGVNVASLVTSAIAAVSATMQRLQPGDVLYTDALATAARSVDTTNIVSATVNTPAASIVPAVNQVIRAGTVSVHG